MTPTALSPQHVPTRDPMEVLGLSQAKEDTRAGAFIVGETSHCLLHGNGNWVAEAESNGQESLGVGLNTMGLKSDIQLLEQTAATNKGLDITNLLSSNDLGENSGLSASLSKNKPMCIMLTPRPNRLLGNGRKGY